jgi:hypothetical protein
MVRVSEDAGIYDLPEGASFERVASHEEDDGR